MIPPGGMRFSYQYPRDFVWLLRIKCFLIGHISDYRLIDLRRALRFWNFSKYKYTCGVCSRCGLNWQDWDRFPWGEGDDHNKQYLDIIEKRTK